MYTQTHMYTHPTLYAYAHKHTCTTHATCMCVHTCTNTHVHIPQTTCRCTHIPVHAPHTNVHTSHTCTRTAHLHPFPQGGCPPPEPPAPTVAVEKLPWFPRTPSQPLPLTPASAEAGGCHLRSNQHSPRPLPRVWPAGPSGKAPA